MWTESVGLDLFVALLVGALAIFLGSMFTQLPSVTLVLQFLQ